MPALMAEPKKPKSDRQRPGPKPDPARARNVIIAIRCRAEYRDWVNRFAESEGTDLSDMFDQLMLNHARDQGFEMPPKR